MGAACLLLLLVAPATVDLIAPGFDAANRERYLDLFRLMLVTPIVFAASITLGEILVAERRFLYYALAPILYNVGIVGGTLLLHDTHGDPGGGGRGGGGRLPPPRHPGGRDAALVGAAALPAGPADCRPCASSSS